MSEPAYFDTSKLRQLFAITIRHRDELETASAWDAQDRELQAARDRSEHGEGDEYPPGKVTEFIYRLRETQEFDRAYQGACQAVMDRGELSYFLPKLEAVRNAHKRLVDEEHASDHRWKDDGRYPAFPSATEQLNSALDEFILLIAGYDFDPIDSPEGIPNGPPVGNYLGLDVDELRGNVKRNGTKVHIAPTSAMWATFLVAWKAGPAGATQAQWDEARTLNAKQRREVKRNLNESLAPLGVGLAPRIPPKLEKI